MSKINKCCGLREDICRAVSWWGTVTEMWKVDFVLYELDAVLLLSLASNFFLSSRDDISILWGEMRSNHHFYQDL